MSSSSSPSPPLCIIIIIIFAFVQLCSLWQAPVVVVVVVMADPRSNIVGQFCSTTPPVVGLTLANNFVSVMDNLSSLVSQSGFGTAFVGDHGPDHVYGLAQCYGDLGPVDCQLCFSEIRSLLPKCYPNVGGRIFLDGCFGRYENHTFFDDALDSENSTVCSNDTSSGSPGFAAAVRKAVGNVTSGAESSGRGYAVGSAAASSSNLKVYVLAQCWGSLNQTLCKSCLDSATSSIVSCSPAAEGRALFAGCYVRYSTHLFWNVQQSTTNHTGKSKFPWIILSSVIGFLVLMFVVAIFARKRRRQVDTSTNSLRDTHGAGLSEAIIRSNLNFRYDELTRATNFFSLSNKLGQGSYGSVYKGVLSDGKEVAVKRLFWNTSQWADQFFNEVDLINRVKHKYLVKLLACSVDGPETLLIYEYYPKKSLDLFIFDAKPESCLNWKQRVDIIQGVAEGLSYLHEESETRIIHRDIKASNILLDEKFKPKITDFGLARSFSEDKTHLTTAIAGTLGYMAPEYIINGHLTEKADVYSYGILILEIVTGKRCNTSLGLNSKDSLLMSVWNHYQANEVKKIIDRLIYDERIRDDILHIVQIGLLCTQEIPRSRPTMSKVVELLRSGRMDAGFILTNPPYLDILQATGGDEDAGEASHWLPMSSFPAGILSRSSTSL